MTTDCAEHTSVANWDVKMQWSRMQWMALVLDVIGNSGKTWFGQIPSLVIRSVALRCQCH